MKPFFLLFVLAFPAFLWTSCSKNSSFPRVETLTKGGKWTLKIGDTPEEVYTQLQALGREKDFNRVALVYRQPYTEPNAVRDIFIYYDAFSLQSASGRVDRVLVQFGHDKVNAIETGGGLLDSVDRWPQNDPDGAAIQKDDSRDMVYEKLTKIYQIPVYQDYRIILPDKPLSLPYDPDMMNYKEWAFEFIQDLGGGRYGQYAVRLYFNRHNLSKISIRYTEGQAYDSSSL